MIVERKRLFVNFMMCCVCAVVSIVQAQNFSAEELAERYASCAAYYLMISKADPKLGKYAQFGVAAADNASCLTSPEVALESMAEETRRFLRIMDNGWANAGAVINSKAEPCKALMTISDDYRD